MIFTHKQLVEVAYRWVLKRGSCGVAFKELVTSGGEIPDVIGFGSGSHSVLIECKASRADFFKDRQKPFRITGRGLGKFRLFCVPAGLIKANELPEKWGLLEVGSDGKAVAVINSTRLCEDDLYTHSHEVNELSERAIMYSALRRLFIRGYIKEIYKEVPTEYLNQ